MDFLIAIAETDGQWSASLLGESSIAVSAPTRWEAIFAMERILQERISNGEIICLTIEAPDGLMALVGKYHDDPTLNDIVEEAYRQRDAELDELVS